MTRRAFVGQAALGIVGAGLAGACRSGPPAPVTIDTVNDSCRFCRMVISDAGTAAQLVSRWGEPLLFDDLGCLRAYLEARPPLSSATVTYVVDHRTREWVRAEAAVYTRRDTFTTPMGSHLMAHASAASRDADPDAREGRPVDLAEIFVTGPPPGAGR